MHFSLIFSSRDQHRPLWRAQAECIEPTLATAIGKVPAGERWIQEIKFEGCRVPLHLANETVLQNELKGKSTRIVMAAFDLLYLSGYDPRKLPPIERKTHLKKPIANTAIQFSESFEIDGPQMFTHACGIGLEGVVSKVRDSRDVSDHGND